MEAVVAFVFDLWVSASVEELSKNKGPDASTIRTVCGHDEGCPALHEAFRLRLGELLGLTTLFFIHSPSPSC